MDSHELFMETVEFTKTLVKSPRGEGVSRWSIDSIEMCELLKTLSHNPELENTFQSLLKSYKDSNGVT